MCRRAWDRGLCSLWIKLCFICKGVHVPGDQKCPLRERQVEVAKVRHIKYVVDTTPFQTLLCAVHPSAASTGVEKGRRSRMLGQ